MNTNRLSEILKLMDFNFCVEMHMQLFENVLNRIDEIWVGPKPTTIHEVFGAMNEQFFVGANITYSLTRLCVEKPGFLNEVMLQMIHDVAVREVVVTDLIDSEYERLRDAKTQEAQASH